MEKNTETMSIDKSILMGALQKTGITQERVLETWKEIVEIESYTHNPAAVKSVGEYVEAKLKDLGLKTKIIEFGVAGPTIVGQIGSGNPSEGIILTGHMDTVHKDGFIEEFPFRVEDGKVFGPGVLDMKGGINIIFYVIQLLKYFGFSKPIKVIISGDEEHGHGKTGSGQVIAEEAKGYKYGLNFETGLITNNVVTSRKGMLYSFLHTKGRSAHAGADFNAGISAIMEMSHKVIEIQQLNGKYGETTFNVGVIKGGTMVNAVPERCEAELDIRFVDDAILPEVKRAVQQIMDTSRVDGAEAEWRISHMMPAFSNDLNGKLFDKYKELSVELGFGEPEGVKVGGASDAAFLTSVGVPCLCGVGTKGQWNHTNREYALADSALERIMLITNLILELENTEI